MTRIQRVLEAVMRLGECTIAQVRAEVGRYISASEAAVVDRRMRRWKERRDGRRHSGGNPRARMVAECLRKLVRRGELRRVRRGVYAPPLPRIFRSA